ncbi:MAG: hypothetical protein LBQ66_10570, partial [Planctomycetaceae bacterium]|nr:hypothetical protein [Planctomycetaceae bacterium]
MKKMLQKMFVILFVPVLCCVGCSGQKLPPDLPKLYSCKITITQGGKPLANANVFLAPANGSKWNASGSTNQQGTVELWTQGMYRGVAEGNFKVVVTKQEIINPP